MQMATIELIIGPMFSGKSTELMRRCSTYKAIGRNVCIINSKLDTRCGQEIQTHSLQTHSAIKVHALCEIEFSVVPDVVAIDEAQFFDDLEYFVSSLEKYNIVILIAGLDGDYKRRFFGHILKIVPIADSITKLQSMCSVCKDGTKASFTKRDDNSTQQICIGAEHNYKAVCRRHYFS